MSNAALGPLMVDLDGLELTSEDREILAHPLVGGVLLFHRNYESPEQVAALTAAIRILRTPPLLIAVDQEGGRVQRFRAPFTRLPPAAAFGRLYRRDPTAAGEAARALGWLMAAELRAVGVDLSFAPVLDLDRGVSTVIGDRAFAPEPVVVGRLAGAFGAGMREAGMVATGKHFPGHGAVAADSHYELPEDARSHAAIAEADLIPFRVLADEGLEAVMMAHVRYPEIDPEPASLSHRWIDGILRRDLGFDGVVFCDDLSMNGAAVAGDYPERARRALAAGCDMLPVCNNRNAVTALLDALPAKAGAPALAGLAGRGPAMGWTQLERSPRRDQARGLIDTLQTLAGGPTREMEAN